MFHSTFYLEPTVEAFSECSSVLLLFEFFQLMLFLNVSDGYSSLRGRRITVDIAKSQSHGHRNKDRISHHGNKDHRRGGDFADIDGSKFRGGIHIEKHTERVPLKLEPRTKPLGDVGKASSNDMNWRSASSRDSSDQGRGRGRGGRGRGRGLNGREGRGAVKRNQGGSNVRKGDTKGAPKVVSEDGWDSAPKTFKAENPATNPVVKEEKKSVTKVSNTFAALQFDSDSD